MKRMSRRDYIYVASMLFGMFFGVLLTVTREGGILENRPVY